MRSLKRLLIGDGDIATKRVAPASAAGLFASFALLMSSAAPVLMGWVGREFSLRSAIALLAVLYLLGAGLMAVRRFLTFARDLVRENCA